MMKKSITWIVASSILLLFVLYFDHSEKTQEYSASIAFEKIEKLNEYNSRELDSLVVKSLSVLKYQKEILDSTFLTSALTNYRFLLDRKELNYTLKESRDQALLQFGVPNEVYEGFVIASQVYFLKRMDKSIRNKIPWITKLKKYNKNVEQLSDCIGEKIFSAIRRNEKEISNFKWFLLITPTPLSEE